MNCPIWSSKYCSLLALIVGIVLGYSLHKYFLGDRESSDFIEIRTGAANGSLTNPLLACKEASEAIISPKQDFYPQLKDYVAEVKRENGIKNLSVSYRDLNNGPSFGVERDEPFIPASLLKVPIFMSYMKHAEENPGILSEKVLYSEEKKTNFIQTIPPEKELKTGTSYTIKTLLEQMVLYSDNQALLLLWNRLPISEYKMLFKLLGFDDSVVDNPTKTISVRQYSAFFRILYNASFLNEKDSGYVLDLLTKSYFKAGIVAGVKEGTPVAHKFGERRLEGGDFQFHECGLVYYPKHPYLLCVMTKGEKQQNLINAVKDVSAFVYEKVDSQYNLAK